MTLTMIGYLIGAGWLLLAALTELILGVEAAQRPLEDVAEPLAAEGTGRKGEEPRREAERRREPRPRPAVPGRRSVYSPRPSFATLDEPPGRLDWEVERIAEAVAQSGPITRGELARQTHASVWGPGRFQRALRAALVQGRIARSGRRAYVAPARQPAPHEPTHRRAA